MSMLFSKPSVQTMKQCLIEELIEHGISNINGLSVYKAEYDDLKQALAVLPYRQIKIDCVESKFF